MEERSSVTHRPQTTQEQKPPILKVTDEDKRGKAVSSKTRTPSGGAKSQEKAIDKSASRTMSAGGAGLGRANTSAKDRPSGAYSLYSVLL